MWHQVLGNLFSTPKSHPAVHTRHIHHPHHCEQAKQAQLLCWIHEPGHVGGEQRPLHSVSRQTMSKQDRLCYCSSRTPVLSYTEGSSTYKTCRDQCSPRLNSLLIWHGASQGNKQIIKPLLLTGGHVKVCQQQPGAANTTLADHVLTERSLLFAFTFLPSPHHSSEEDPLI